MKKLLLSALLATALLSAPAMAKVEPDIIKTSYGDFDAQGQLLSANETALKAMNFKTVQKKANQGDKDAQFHLAKMYQLGIHTQIDMQKSQEWYKKSAENGNANAMNNYVGYLDENEALIWYKKASDLNQPHAKMALAIYHIDKKTDIQKGVDILLELGENGFAPAYFVLSQVAEILPKDISEKLYQNENDFFNYLKKSAEMGFAPAQMALSDYYQKNYVMNADKIVRPTGIINAYKWANRACVNGVERGCQTAEHFATIKNADFGDEKKQCEMGNQDACENYKISKYIQEEMNKLGK
ncbi:MAG: tetratricopeptide repeat protein [Moraxella sp.]|uniref:tetratricopeptide repeat protein n=1 Tax=Moraxella sp. TaxID=479 RepID=UPI0026DAF4D2|nr:tetratricopeptide repeat protein [Moraxella sp.]MDO4451049.1 tetratricopeptide repeat protein [Moraxella sp.]